MIFLPASEMNCNKYFCYFQGTIHLTSTMKRFRHEIKIHTSFFNSFFLESWKQQHKNTHPKKKCIKKIFQRLTFKVREMHIRYEHITKIFISSLFVFFCCVFFLFPFLYWICSSSKEILLMKKINVQFFLLCNFCSLLFLILLFMIILE